MSASYSGDANYESSFASGVPVVVALPPSPIVPVLGNVTLPVSVTPGGTLVGKVPVVLTNTGAALYQGIEGEATYSFDNGISLFTNAGLMLPEALTVIC